MIPIIEQLLILQDRDQRIQALRAELARIPQERQLRERQLAESASRLEKAKTRLREIEVEKNSLEMEAATHRTSIERYKSQQLQTRKNEEYSALQHEIQAANKSIVAIEDREIELMEEAETLTPTIARAEAEHTEEKDKITKALTALEARTPNIEARIKEFLDGRQKDCDGLDEEILDRYERLFKSKSGNAVVALENEVCTGCHMRVTNQTALEVRGGQSIVHCPNCGRILHLPS